MKIYFVVALLITVSVNAQFSPNQDSQNNIKECLVEAKLPADLEKLQANNPLGLLSNPKFKCFSACLMRKKGSIKDGRIDTYQQLAELMIESPEAYEILKDIVKACSDTANKNEDECEVADSYVKCIITNISLY